MKYCRKMARISGWVSILFAMPFGVLILICGLWSLIGDIWYLWGPRIVFSIFFISTSPFLLWFGAIESSFELRKYSITSEGLYLGRPKNTFYTWDQICEIGVFPFDAAASLEVYDRVICICLAPPVENIKKKLFHNPRFYAQRNQDKFVIMDYDEKIMGVLSAVYQKEIVDYTIGMKGYIRSGRRKGDVKWH